MTTNRGRDDELVDLEPERRSKRTGDGETATRRDRRAAGDAPERRPSRRARRSERRSGRSGVAGVERERQRSGDWRGGCDAARERERNGTRVWGGEGRPGPAAAYMWRLRIQQSGGAAPHQRSWGRAGPRGRVGGLGRSRPGRFSACYWAAIGSPTFGPCFGPARRAGVAAQALKGHRAGPALSPIDRA
jgi:hypothetical protein